MSAEFFKKIQRRLISTDREKRNRNIPVPAQEKHGREENVIVSHHPLIPKNLLLDDEVLLTDASPEQKAIIKKIRGIEWYHSIDLGNGVVTPGAFDHRPYLKKYRLPDHLDGMRVLDVATFDGFWAFEFERRGAAEVVAIDIETANDIDLPPIVKSRMSEDQLNRKTGEGFEMAKKVLGSKVRREILNVYDLSPERVGRFDMVFCSDLLIHLMNPFKVLQNIFSVVSGFALISEMTDPGLNQYPHKTLLHHAGGIKDCLWWIFGKDSLEFIIRNAGFQRVELISEFELKLSSRRKSDISGHHVVFKACP